MLDLHGYLIPDTLQAWYTNNNDAPGDAAMETLRMTSTRALWDPNYLVPESDAER